MAQAGYTPIQLYYSPATMNVPSPADLAAGELAINTFDGKLFYKDPSNVIQVIGTKGGVGSSSTTQILYNSGGLVVGSGNLTFNGTVLTAAGFSGPINGTVGATTPLAGSFTTLAVTGNTSLATTPVLYGSDGAVSSGRLVGRYSYRNPTPATAYFYDFNNTNTITSADSVAVSRLATLIDSLVANANALTAYGTSYGTKAAGLSFISGTASDILLASVAGTPLLNADINAVVVGYTSVGPRILVQNYALDDDTANAISYVGAVHRFYPAGSAVVTINSTGLGVTGLLTVSELTGTTAAAATIASAATIAPTKDITFISGTAAVVTITAIAPFTTGGGTITLIPTGAFTWTTAGNIALAGTAVVSRALTMTYDSTTTKWYPSYV